MSDLRSRLTALRGQAGASELESLRHRIERVGAGRRRRAPRRMRPSDATLASRLGGVVVREGVVLVRERLPVDSAHGAFALSEEGFAEALSYCDAAAGRDARACV
ncbi:MAG: hypothetical protein GWN21_06275, partial [Gammaproteobacteria bacterium]|nr:hypothetical protein [Gammaproteobacteria bacterium]NIP88316.1 hypothetical protein [Gammaproteobacteria bacterium]NIR22758.1 hypothetical protein [Gammaproteobacteria bacterium]NIS04648.1 hypothetical protein [Gammaproteobacteria bacterium]NIU40504.1 hypothetical protein [Gammaproteobacteria bacterium]